MEMYLLIAVTSSLILISYFFEMFKKKIAVPTILLLIFSGILIKYLFNYLKIDLHFIDELLPYFGTIGLILIVLEGSLDLVLNRDKKNFIIKTFIFALFLMISTSFILALIFKFFFKESFFVCFINAIPFSIISSAVAIPSSEYLNSNNREFIIYESSMSDILGILFFNILAFNNTFDIMCFVNIGLNLILTVIISILTCIVLIFLFNRINHHIKFFPLIALLFLFYALSKLLHLSPLLLIFMFGILFNNINILFKYGFDKYVKLENFFEERDQFKIIIYESVFVIKTFFFISFGYLINLDNLLGIETMILSVFILAIIFIVRGLSMKQIFSMPLNSLLFFAPRGLITILLFLSIPENLKIIRINSSILMIVIIVTSIFMTYSIFLEKRAAKAV